NLAIEQDDKKNYQSTGNGFRLQGCERMKIACITSETDGRGCNRQRGLHKRLPDEKEGHQVAPFTGPVAFAKENVGAARFRHCGPQFRPDKNAQSGKECAGQPGNQSLGTAHSLDDEGTNAKCTKPTVSIYFTP